jgi:hypothetical protein
MNRTRIPEPLSIAGVTAGLLGAGDSRTPDERVYHSVMTSRRRLLAWFFVTLQLLLSVRPAVALNARTHDLGTARTHASDATAPAGHRSPAGHDGLDEHHGPVVGQASSSHHAPDAPANHPAHQAPAGSPHSDGTHTDAGCHGAPCCAPTLPDTPVGASGAAPPVVGALPVVATTPRDSGRDTARWLPPATAPPLV